MPALILQLIGLLDELCESLPIDTNRLFLSGASMGGDGVYSLAAASNSARRRFAALMPVCAGLNLKAAATLARRSDIAIWIWHGVQDAVYPIAHADAMHEALLDNGEQDNGSDPPSPPSVAPHRVRYTRLENCATPSTSPHAVGHAAWLDAFAAESGLWPWLKEQRRLDEQDGPPI